MQYKKKAQCSFESAKIHWAFYRFTNVFQMIFAALSNFICYEVSFIYYWLYVKSSIIR